MEISRKRRTVPVWLLLWEESMVLGAAQGVDLEMDIGAKDAEGDLQSLLQGQLSVPTVGRAGLGKRSVPCCEE